VSKVAVMSGPGLADAGVEHGWLRKVGEAVVRETAEWSVEASLDDSTKPTVTTTPTDHDLLSKLITHVPETANASAVLHRVAFSGEAPKRVFVELKPTTH
jgi:hypothetical protein